MAELQQKFGGNFSDLYTHLSDSLRQKVALVDSVFIISSCNFL